MDAIRCPVKFAVAVFGATLFIASSAYAVFDIQGATVTLADNIQFNVVGGLYVNSGRLSAGATQIQVSSGDMSFAPNGFSAGASTITVNGNIGFDFDSNNNALYNLVLGLNTGSAFNIIGSSLTVSRDFTILGGSVTMEAAGNTLGVAGNLILNGGTLNPGSSDAGIDVSGNWQFLSGEFVPGIATVTFQGAGTSTSTLTGSTTFYSLVVVTPGKTIVLPANSTQTIRGQLVLTGSSGSGNLIKWVSSSTGTYAYMVNSGTNTVSFTQPQDNNAGGGQTIVAGANSVDNGHNVNWTFAILGVSVSTGSYNFGTVNLAATTISTAAIVVSNTGNTTETYSLFVATTGAQTRWSVGASTPTSFNTFVLFGTMNATQPTPGGFGSEDVILTSAQACNATRYSSGGQTCLSTAAGSTRNLWMRLDMPLSTATTAQQQMTVSITAASP